MTRILVVDNYDSFVYNLVHYLRELGAQCDVRRNDAVTVAEAGDYDGILLSPGPGVPEAAGICVDVVKQHAGAVPILGVCLGHQAIGVAYGATVARAFELLHGKTSRVHHDGSGVLAGLPDPFTATRYHSLAIVEDTMPAALPAGRGLVVTARSDSGVVMGVRAAGGAVEGVQFHPESILTEGGHLLLGNWLATCGLPEAVERASRLDMAVVRSFAGSPVPADSPR